MVDTNAELRFDRGTLSLSGVNRTQDDQLGFSWDERVQILRAQAYHYSEIRQRLPASCQDAVGGLWAASGSGCWQTIDLRPYQEAALRAWSAKSGRGIVVLPTGAGKTRLALAAMARLGLSTLCLVPTRVLLAQWVEQIKQVYSGPLGVFGDGARDLQRVTIATFESAYRHMSEWGSRFQLLVIDEVHHFGDGARDEVLEMAIAPMRLGLSASIGENSCPEHLTQIVGPVVYDIRLAALVGTYLSPFEVVTRHLPLNPEERRRYAAEMRVFQNFSRTFQNLSPRATWLDLVRYANRSEDGRRAMTAFRRARQLVSFTQGKAETLTFLMRQHIEARSIIFTATTRDAYCISSAFLMPVITGAIDRKERDLIIQRFRDGIYRSIVSCRVLNEGFDVPDAEIAIITGGAHGEREHIQRIGRILRPKEGKKAIVYELVAADTLEVGQAGRRGKALRR